MSSEQILHQSVKEAKLVFWGKIAELYPEAKSGDLDPLSDAFLETAMEQVVKTWLKYNCK